MALREESASALSSKRPLPLAQRAFLRDDATHACNARANRHKRDHAAFRFHSEVHQHDEVILALKPVAYHYNNDATNTPSFGLIAEEVAEVNPDLVALDKEGKPYTVRYEQVNVMLLNEFLKEHKKVQNLEVAVAQQQKGMEVLTAQLKEQAAQIQKVSARLEVNKPTQKVVLSNP